MLMDFFSLFMQVSDQETQLLNMRDINLALVVKTVDNALKRINFYPVDSQKQFTNIYLLDCIVHPSKKWDLLVILLDSIDCWGDPMKCRGYQKFNNCVSSQNTQMTDSCQENFVSVGKNLYSSDRNQTHEFLLIRVLNLGGRPKVLSLEPDFLSSEF